MKNHIYRVTLAHVAGKSPDDILHEPLQFDCTNHDDIFAIIARLQSAGLFEGDENAAFATGLKLFSEIMLNHRDHPLFADFREPFGEFMKTLKAQSKAASQD